MRYPQELALKKIFVGNSGRRQLQYMLAATKLTSSSLLMFWKCFILKATLERELNSNENCARDDAVMLGVVSRDLSRHFIQ